MIEDKMYKPTVSVIIPMYNCEAFVTNLLKMFSGQSFKDFEVICVIDGATDGTEEAVKKYCEIDDRFRYVVRDNGGAGAARNTGIDEANGKYIIFSDADDLYSKDYLLKLYTAAERNDAEIAVCGTITFDYISGEWRKNISIDKTNLLEDEIYSVKKAKRILRMIDVQVSNKLFRLDFIKQQRIVFSETPASNDLFFSKAAVACSERIVVIHDDLITIRRHINPDSISSKRGKYTHIALLEFQKLYNWMEERDLIGTYITDWLHLFDVTANYEMKNGINPFFADEFARILNCEKPWIELNSDQIKQILIRSLGEKGNEKIKKPEKDLAYEDLEKLKAYNEISGERNSNKLHMQEMVKKTSIDKYSRDIDDPNSEGPEQKQNGSENDNYDTGLTRVENNSRMSEVPEITVIIPMYNCADFVTGVLSMFSGQTFSDFEVICVIDGATDKTEELVKEYCEKDQRFSFIYKKNGGPGSARNAGLDIARGRYIIFSDADDEYSPDYLKKLYEAAVKNDAQITNCLFSKRGALSSQNLKGRGFDTKIFFENIVYSHRGIDDLFTIFQSRVTNKLYSSRFLNTQKLRFPELRIAEDAYFSYAGFSVADRIVVVHDDLITYVVHNDHESLMDNSKKYLCDVVNVYRLFYQWLKEHSLLEMHGADYMRRMDMALQFYGGKGTTLKFISEVAHILNAEEPWCLMTSDEILDYFRETLFSENAIKKESEINTKIKSELSDKQREDYNYKLIKFRNMIHMAELLRLVSLKRYGRDFNKKDSLPDNTNGVLLRVLTVDDKKDSKRLIVSLTSYPARINFVSQVMESLYTQSLQADKIILWLAEEQFPKKEADLPDSLLADAYAGNFELRWCDDLGSHKKYYYAMQEYPHDVIVTVDDDIIYDPYMLVTLYESYLRFPSAVSAHRVSCMHFDNGGELLPPECWTLPFEVIKDTPSSQLMAIGSRGILYPPGIIDKSAFDLEIIKQLCGFKDTFFLNDSWLKIHELLNGIPVVYTESDYESFAIEETQKKRIKALSDNTALLHNKEHEMWLKMQRDHTESDRLRKSISTIKNNDTYIPSQEDGVLSNIACRLASLVNRKDITKEKLIKIIHNTINELNRLKSFGVSEEKWNSYMEKYQIVMRDIVEPGGLSPNNLSFYALRDYSFVLRNGLYSSKFKTSSQYNQMLASWRAFFSKYPDCDEIYLKSYDEFIKNLENAEKEDFVTVQIPVDKTESPIVSVVIPMYNCEKYVSGVLSMFASQTFTEFEVICVIDGAEDGTENEVKKFCEMDSRFRYVVRENGGAGVARNTGLEIATGKYVIFADADDVYYPDYLKKLYETAEKYYAQMVICCYVKKDYATQEEKKLGVNRKKFLENTVYSHSDIDNLFNSFVTHIPNTLFKTSFLKKNELRFPEARVGEDACFNFAALSVSDRIVMIYDVLLEYRFLINPDSLSSNRTMYCHEAVDAHRWLYKYLKSHSALDKHMIDFMKRVDDYLSYESGNKVTPRFISEFAHMLNAEEPFDTMTSGEIRTYLKEGLFAENAVQKEKELKTNVDSKTIEADKELTFLLNVYRDRIHTAELIRKVSKDRYGRDFERKDSLPTDSALHKYLPLKVRLEASTICQLRCAGCGFQKGGTDDLGRGYLTIENFRRFCEMNPFVRQIELSNYGEIFMNPDLVQIMYEAKDRGIKLFSMNGSNFNTVSDEQMHALVETGFRGITLSIDGASQETYSKYRIRGNFDTVIENVRKLQKLKKDAGTEYPKLRWNFILMEHNELEIGKAKAMAEELGIPIRFKYNWDKTYKPVHRDYIMKETGLTELTEAEYKSAHKLDPFDSLCKEIFLTPQINWDGRMLGCCTRRYATFDVNVFEVGLEAAMKSPRYMQAKECLLTVHPDKEKYGSCTCYECGKRLQREKAGMALEL